MVLRLTEPRGRPRLWIAPPEPRAVDLPQRACHPAGMNHRKSPLFAANKAFDRNNHLRLIFVLVLMAFGRLAARAEWPEFRGQWGDGHASAPGDAHLIGLPLYWSETNNIKWKTAIP